MSDHKEVLKRAKEQANLNLADKRIAVLDTKNENDELGIADDYAVSLKAILKHYDKPLSLGLISEVLPDSSRLLKVRKQLRKSTADQVAEIEEYKDGEDQTRIMIKLLPTAEPAAVEPTVEKAVVPVAPTAEASAA